MRKGYEAPVIDIVSLESKEVVCANDFFNLFGIGGGASAQGGPTLMQEVFDWTGLSNN